MTRPSHVCQSCGMDLGRLRALRDPDLGIAIVRCTRCGACAARRDLAASRRRVRSTVATITTLVSHAVITLVLFILCAVAASLTGHALHVYGLAGMNTRSALFMLALLACATGLWLAIGLSHVRTALLVPGWFAAVGVAATIDYTIPSALTALMRRYDPMLGPPPCSPQEAGSRLLACAGLLGATALAAGAGSIIRRTEPAMRARRWRNRLARVRKRRASA